MSSSATHQQQGAGVSSRAGQRRRFIELFDALALRCKLPQISHVGIEHRKINIARIVFGFVLIDRLAHMVPAANYYFPATTSLLGIQVAPQSVAVLIVLLLGVLFTIGFLTPLMNIALIVSLPMMDEYLATETLGTHLSLMLLIYFLLVGGGSNLSVDAFFLRRSQLPLLQRAVKVSYSLFGVPRTTELVRARFLLLIAFACEHFGSALLHVMDPVWRQGSTAGVLLTDAYFSRFYEVFRWIEEVAQIPFRMFSKLSIALQTIFQLAMLPLLFHRTLRWFVIVYGALFIGMAVTGLRLTYMPYVEAIIFAMLFLPGIVKSRPRWYSRLLTSGNFTQISFPANRRALTAVGCLWLCLLMLFVVHQPAVRSASNSVLGVSLDAVVSHAHLREVMLLIGMDPLNGFHKYDLMISDQWPVMYRKVKGSDRQLVPYTGLDGERLDYHNNDVVYFGNSVFWRRAMVGSDLNAPILPGSHPHASVYRIAQYDYRRQKLSGSVAYVVDIYSSRASDLDLPVAKRFQRKKMQSFGFILDESSSIPPSQPLRWSAWFYKSDGSVRYD